MSIVHGESERELLDRWMTRLREVFADEASSVQRYANFAQAATIEGWVEVSRLFEEMAESTGCVAQGHLDFLAEGGDPATGRRIGETQLNLAAALLSEQRDAAEVYPSLAASAIADGLHDLGSWLTTLGALKTAHVARLQAALEGLTQRSLPGQASSPASA